ncbi:MAG: NAD-dependent epimerase [Bernardetiaceae bacterium]
MTRILITGTAGFIGFHLVKRLLHDSYQILGIDSLNDYYDPKLKLGRLRQCGITESRYGEWNTSQTNPNYTFVRLQLEDEKGLRQLFEQWKPTYVINLAAQAGVRYSLQNPQAYLQSNIVGFGNILECCRHYQVEHLVYASSSSVYGLNKTVPFSTAHNVDHPISLYAATKKSNELMAHTYSHLFGLPTTGLRFFTVYGPWGRPDMAAFLFTKAILNGDPIQVFNNGAMQRDFTYVDDIVEGIQRILTHLPEGQTFAGSIPSPAVSTAPYRLYNIGNNNPVALMDFIAAVENALGKKAKKEFRPIQPGDVETTYADVDDLIQSVGYRPQTDIEAGIQAFVDWYKEYYTS